MRSSEPRPRRFSSIPARTEGARRLTTPRQTRWADDGTSMTRFVGRLMSAGPPNRVAYDAQRARVEATNIRFLAAEIAEQMAGTADAFAAMLETNAARRSPARDVLAEREREIARNQRRNAARLRSGPTGGIGLETRPDLAAPADNLAGHCPAQTLRAALYRRTLSLLLGSSLEAPGWTSTGRARRRCSGISSAR